jgi:hypothetical protein
MGLLSLWAGVLLPPFAWFLNLLIGYTLVPWACATGRQFALHWMTLAMLLLASAGGFIAWRHRQPTGDGQLDKAGDILARSRFMAIGGLLSSTMFFLAILAQSIPSFILSACEP